MSAGGGCSYWGDAVWGVSRCKPLCGGGSKKLTGLHPQYPSWQRAVSTFLESQNPAPFSVLRLL